MNNQTQSNDQPITQDNWSCNSERDQDGNRQEKVHSSDRGLEGGHHQLHGMYLLDLFIDGAGI